jgi:integrase
LAYYQKVSAKNKQGYKWKCTEDAPRDPLSGKRRQITRRGDTKKEAYEKILVGMEEIKKIDSSGLDQNFFELTVHELFERWFELILKRKIKETTYREYNNTSNYRILPILGSYKVKQLNSVLLQKFINDLSDEGLSPRYVEYISTILFGALEAARKWKIIQFNPLVDVEKPRPRRVEQKTWTIDEMNTFLKVTKLSDIRLFTIASTALKTGGRRGEVLSLKWSNLVVADKKITIERTLIYDKNGFRFGTPKSTYSVRTINIGDSLIQELKEWKAHQNQIKMAFRQSFKDNDLIFTTETGKPIFPRSLTASFNRAIKIADVTKIRFHDLRHTHATMCLEAGMSLKEVQVRLGHSSIKTTGDVYAHVTDTMKEKSTDLFEKYISN